MTLSKNFQKQLSAMVTNEMIEYLNSGYSIKPGNASLGLELCVELTKFDNKYIRISVSSDYYFDKENRLDLEKIVFSVEEFEENKWSSKDAKTIKEEVFYTYNAHRGTKLFTLEEMIKNNEVSKSRYANRTTNPNFINKQFTPKNKINIKGFKSLKPEDVTIVRSYNKITKINLYKIKNNKTGKIKEVKI